MSPIDLICLLYVFIEIVKYLYNWRLQKREKQMDSADKVFFI